MNFRTTPPSILNAQASAAPVVPGADHEAVALPVPIQAATDTTVYATKRRWSGVDVYVTTNGTTFQGPFGSNLYTSIVFLVFAVVGNNRTLVGSGRLSRDDASVGTPGTAKHVVSVRAAIASNFEVVMSTNDLGGGTIAANAIANVAVVASDEANSGKKNLGVVPCYCSALTGEFPALIGDVQIRRNPAAGSQVQQYVHGVNVANAGFGIRHLMLFDSSIAVVNGQRPLWTVALAADTSVAIEDDLLAQYRFRFGIVAAISTTPTLLTLGSVDELAYQLYFR